jgi:rhodanese-related sulfurtransferase
MKNLLASLLLLFFLPLTVQAQSQDFPGRATYPNVNFYEMDKLYQDFDNVIIVDVRSNYEYETLHINTAVNIPLSSKTFSDKVHDLATQNKDIVFYCNGHTCYKSYKAVLKARNAGIDRTFTFDAGIFDWAKAYPQKSTMLGTTPIDSKKLISKEKFHEHLLTPDEFSAQINDKSVILDIREPAQRGLMELYPYRQENISMAEKEKLNKFLDKVLQSGKTLLAYDEAGKQVAWLQYKLEAKGITKYYFMKGGVKQFFKDKRKKKG